MVLLISARTDGNLKILRIYVSNFSPHVRSRDRRSRERMWSNNLRGTRVSVLFDAICAAPLATANSITHTIGRNYCSEIFNQGTLLKTKRYYP